MLFQPLGDVRVEFTNGIGCLVGNSSQHRVAGLRTEMAAAQYTMRTTHTPNQRGRCARRSPRRVLAPATCNEEYQDETHFVSGRHHLRFEPGPKSVNSARSTPSIQQNVGWLDIAMNETLSMCGGQFLLRSERPMRTISVTSNGPLLPSFSCRRTAGDVLHYEKRWIALGFDIVNWHDMIIDDSCLRIGLPGANRWRAGPLLAK